MLSIKTNNLCIQVGEIVVYNVKGKDIPIVHRVVRKFGSG
jgi:signal peptidase